MPGRYRFILVLLLLCMKWVSYAQTTYRLSGVVVDEEGQVLPGASVFLYPIEEGTIANQEGMYFFNDLPGGQYTLEVSFIGFNPLIDTILLTADKYHAARLQSAYLTLQEVVVSDNYIESRKNEESLNIEIVNDDYLKQNLGGSLAGSIERLPGITAYDIGSGQSKPVIRGLGFNRVVVVENNIKHQAQQWGADHGLEIDQYAVDNIEIIKGPASLMYGSDAIGGVIDMKNRHIPPDNTLGGTIDLSGKTNNDFLGTSLSLHGRKNRFFANIRATILDYGDYKVPADSVDIYSYRVPLYENHLRNTAGYERNLHLSLGIVDEKFQNTVYISSVNMKNGFFANAHGLEPRNVNTDLHDKSDRDIHYPYQTVSHLKLINSGNYRAEDFRLEYSAGFQRNFRQEFSQYVNHGYMPAEFPDTLDFDSDLEREFLKFIYSGNLKMSFPLNDRANMSIGTNTEYMDNRIDGRGFIIPAYDQLNIGGFMFIRQQMNDNLLFLAGLRYDHGNIRTKEYSDWFPSLLVQEDDTSFLHLIRAKAIDRNFSSFSWSTGLSFRQNKWTLKANAGKSFRMPIAKELAASGVDYHMFRYVVGNDELSPEVSYQLDAGAEYSAKKLAIGATPFLNYFPNYIYLNPTSQHNRDYGAGNQVYYYTQSRVLRYGAEIHAHYQIMKSVTMGLIGEYVYAEQLSGEKKGFTLPFSPPASAILNVKYQKQRIFFIENAYFSFDYRLVGAQNKVVPPEEPTAGYQLINIALGGSVEVQNQKISVSMQLRNLLNNSYFNHTSYYRLINVPEPGRKFSVTISIPFLIHSKQYVKQNKS